MIRKMLEMGYAILVTTAAPSCFEFAVGGLFLIVMIVFFATVLAACGGS